MLNLLTMLICLKANALSADLPFWKAKEKLYERIQNGDVIVSVREESLGAGEPKHRLVLSGGGHVGAPCDFVYHEALNFEDIARTSGYIRDPKFDAKTHTLEFTISAFFHSAKMKTRLDSQSEPPPARIDSTLLNGPLQGFFYRMTFDPLPNGKCEVAVQGHFEYSTFPIPRMFLEFGMETVFQVMAKRLRAHVEERHRKP